MGFYGVGGEERQVYDASYVKVREANVQASLSAISSIGDNKENF